MNATPLLLLFRPEAQSRRLLDEIESDVQRQVTAIIAPIMRIEDTGEVPDLGAFSGVILTSENAARRIPDLMRKQVWCVGERVAAKARKQGAGQVTKCKDADELVALITDENPSGQFIHLSGRHHRGDIAERLNLAGVETERAVIYDQVVQLPDRAATAALEGDDKVVLPLFSPRSARLLGQALVRLGAGTHVIAMSDAIAEAWAAETGGSAEICARPTGAEMRRRIVAALLR